MTAPGLTLDDWDELLQLNRLIPKLTAGELRPVEARLRLDQRRQVYPGLQLDYVRAIEAFGGVIDKVDEAIAEQNDALDRLNRSLADIGETFSFDPTRLLTAGERDALTALQLSIKREMEDKASAARHAEEAAEEIEQELESLQQELENLEGDAEDIESQIEDLIDEMDEGE